MSEKTDHDLIVEHSIEIKTLCKSVDNLGDKFDNFREKEELYGKQNRKNIYDKIEHLVDKKTFRWIVGIIIVVIIGISSVARVNQVNISENKGAVEIIEKIMEKSWS